MLKELSYLLDLSHQKAQQNPPKQREREATAGALLGHLMFMKYHLNELVLYLQKGKSTKVKVNVSKREKSKSAN